MMYCILTDHPPGIIGAWAHLDQCQRYARKLEAGGWTATIKPMDFPVTIATRKAASGIARRQRRLFRGVS